MFCGQPWAQTDPGGFLQILIHCQLQQHTSLLTGTRRVHFSGTCDPLEQTWVLSPERSSLWAQVTENASYVMMSWAVLAIESGLPAWKCRTSPSPASSWETFGLPPRVLVQMAGGTCGKSTNTSLSSLIYGALQETRRTCFLI